MLPDILRYFYDKIFPKHNGEDYTKTEVILKIQNHKIPFGPNNVKGSISSLITRGLIEQKKVNWNGLNELLWQVTDECFAILKRMGIEVPC